MKSILQTLLLSVVLTTIAYGQVDFTLEINHKLGEEPFAFNQSCINNLDDQFMVDRLEYYISGISILHDGGQRTVVDDLYILVDASEPTSIELGSYTDIVHVESLNFFIGVDETANHSDPASYPSGHALAPQAPSMHWGWAAGYRFVAFEGYGGNNLDQRIELHGLIDANYYRNSVEIDMDVSGSSFNIVVDADYIRVLENIDVFQGVIVHGGNSQAKRSLENFRDFVFTAGEGMSAVVNQTDDMSLQVYPNPVIDGTVSIQLNSANALPYHISVRDMLGRRIQFIDAENVVGTMSINLPNAGLYFVDVLLDGKSVQSEKIIRL